MVPSIVIEIVELFGLDVDDVMEWYTEACALNPDCGVDEFLMGFFAEKSAKHINYPNRTMAEIDLKNYKDTIEMSGFCPAIMVSQFISYEKRGEVPNQHFLWTHGWTNLDDAKVCESDDEVWLSFPKLETWDDDIMERFPTLTSWQKIMFEKITGRAIILEE